MADDVSKVDVSKFLADHFSGQFKSMEEAAQKKIDARLEKFDEHERRARDKFDARMRSLEDRLTADVKIRVFQIALSVVALAAAAMLIGSFAATKEVNSSVVALQKDLISAQTTIRTADKDLRDQAQALANASAALTTKQAELSAAETRFKEEAVRLVEARKQYEELARSHKPAKTP